MLPPDPRKLLPAKNPADAGPDYQPPAPAAHESDAHTPPAALSSAPSLGALFNALRRCWRTAVPVAVLGGLLAAGLGWVLAPSEYTSTVVFRILSRPPQGSLENEDNFANVQKAQVAILKSYDVVNDAIARSRVEERFGLRLSPLKVQKKLTATFPEGPEMAFVTFSAADPAAAAALLNALGEVYPARVNAAEEGRVKQRVEQLRRLLLPTPGSLAERLRDKRVERNEAEKKAGILDDDATQAKMNSALAMQQAAQAEARASRRAWIGFEAELENKKRRVENPPLPAVSEGDAEDLLRTDSRYQKLAKEIGAVREEIETLRSVGKVESSAEVRGSVRAAEALLRRKRLEQGQLLGDARRRVARARQALLVELEERAARELEDKIKQEKRQELASEAEARRWGAEADRYRNGGPKAPPEVEALRDQVKQLEKQVGAVSTNLAALEGSLPLAPRVTLASEAFVPNEKDLAKPIKFSLGAGAGVFGLLLVGVCLLEARGRRISASDDLIHGLGLRVVGILPRLPAALRQRSAFVAARTDPALAALESQFGMTEAVDAVRTVLLHAPNIDGARVVMVTSAVSGEGKTTLASHLAASLARAWRKTLLIDGDLRNPTQHLQFEQDLGPGLSEALRGEVEFDDVVKPTAVSRLWLMPAGQVDGHALQALAQEGVGNVFARLADQYDFLVIDTSPVLPVPDALLLGKQADAVLLAVMRDVSRLPAVYAAQQRLDALGIRLLGAVVLGERTETYGKAVAYPRQ
jgi:capsular exopolysaccharide synthesis family protein